MNFLQLISLLLVISILAVSAYLIFEKQNTNYIYNRDLFLNATAVGKIFNGSYTSSSAYTYGILSPNITSPGSISGIGPSNFTCFSIFYLEQSDTPNNRQILQPSINLCIHANTTIYSNYIQTSYMSIYRIDSNLSQNNFTLSNYTYRNFKYYLAYFTPPNVSQAYGYNPYNIAGCAAIYKNILFTCSVSQQQNTTASVIFLANKSQVRSFINAEINQLYASNAIH